MATTPAVDVATIEATDKEYWSAFEALDTDRAAACFAADAELITPDGTYVGREAIREWLRWAFSMVTEARIEECGLGSTVAGNKQFREYREIAVTIDGLRYDMHCMAIAEFNDSGEYQRVSWLPDQWQLIRQVDQQSKGLRRVLVHPLLASADQLRTVQRAPGTLTAVARPGRLRESGTCFREHRGRTTSRHRTGKRYAVLIAAMVGRS